MGRLPVSQRRNIPGLNRRKILVDYWAEISPYGYLMWRWRKMRTNRASQQAG